MLTILNSISQAGLFLATVALAYIAYYQIGKIRAQSNADFITRINKEFFYDNEMNRKIIKTIEERKPILKKNRGVFSAYDLNGYLRYFELIERFVADGVVSFDLVDEMFGNDIARAWENREIENYVMQLRKEKQDTRYFEHFEQLAKKIIALEHRHRSEDR